MIHGVVQQKLTYKQGDLAQTLFHQLGDDLTSVRDLISGIHMLPERVPLGLTLDELCAEEREVLLQLGALRAVLRVAERIPVGHLVLNLKFRSARFSITLFYHTISLYHCFL